MFPRQLSRKARMTQFRSLLLIAGFLALIVAPRPAFSADPPAVDANTIDRARTLQKSGQLVAAEKLLREVLVAVDAGKLPSNQLGRCLNSLSDIYRIWGRN